MKKYPYSLTVITSTLKAISQTQNYANTIANLELEFEYRIREPKKNFYRIRYYFKSSETRDLFLLICQGSDDIIDFTIKDRKVNASIV